MHPEDTKKSMEVAEEARAQKYEKPSFARLLFLGSFKPSFLFPFPEQRREDKKEGEQLIERVSAYLKEHLDPDAVDAEREIPKEVIEELQKMGVFALKIPKEYGGVGFSNSNYNRLVQKVASFCGSTAVLISAHQSIGVPQPLIMFGTEEQKKKFFPRFSKGSISAFALTEPEVGSDPARIETEALLSEDGSHYILNGEKLWCTNGTLADLIVVIAKTRPKRVEGREKRQISAFILEMDSPGVEVVQRCEFMGLKGIYNGRIRFKDVRIPAENLLGEEGRGLAMALAIINVGRLTLPAACSGVAKQCLSIVRRWGKERVQWGQPIGLHEAGREKIAYIASTTLAMEAVTWLTSHWADLGERDIRIEAAMAKLFCTEALWKITDLSMQLRGGRGYETALSLKARGEEPFPVERAMRDCRINTILEGTSEIMKLFLAREAMDPHIERLKPLLKGKIAPWQLAKAFFHYAAWYPGQWLRSLFPSSFKEMAPFEKQFAFIEKSSHRLARKLFSSMVKEGKKLERKQMLLGRLMEIGCDLFAMASVCSYALHLQKERGDSPLPLARHFCALAKRRIQTNFSSLSDNDDEGANLIAPEILEKRALWLEEGLIAIGSEEPPS